MQVEKRPAKKTAMSMSHINWRLEIERGRRSPAINLDALIFASINSRRVSIGRIGMRLHHNGYLSGERRWVRRRVVGIHVA